MIGILAAAVVWGMVSLISPVFASSDYSDWAVVVVAGDDHAHDGTITEGFDNARRDVSTEFEKLGFSKDNIREFSAQPSRYNDASLKRSTIHGIANALWNLSNETSGGCLVYFSTHGSEDGLVVGDKMLPPRELALMVDNACANRPTVVILSACFSGVFVPGLKGPNRFILTAARRDRASFGCSQDYRYPFFDNCVIQVIPHASGFGDMADKVRACVSAREHKEDVSPPSQPQLFVGAKIMQNLHSWR